MYSFSNAIRAAEVPSTENHTIRDRESRTVEQPKTEAQEEGLENLGLVERVV
jgi:hypothetical protein